MKQLSAAEIQGVLGADGAVRYAHFVKQVADWSQVWGLRASDGWVSMSDESGVPMFPVWPHATYAQLLATDAWASAVPAPIDVHAWIAEWLPGMSDDGTRLAVFPTPHGRGVVVDPQTLRADLESELSRLD